MKTELKDWPSRFGLKAKWMLDLAAAWEALGRPQGVVQGLERLFGRILAGGGRFSFLADPLAQKALVRLGFSAPFLIRHLAAHPAGLEQGLLSGLEGPAALWPHEGFPSETALVELEEGVLMRTLRLWKYDNYVRLTAQELLELHDTKRTCALLSELADGVIRTAYRYGFARLVARLGVPLGAEGRPALGTVIGMGKLGGRELNYASDVDLIFIHEAADGPCRILARPPLAESGPLRLGAEAWQPWESLAADALESAEPGRASGGEFHDQLARLVIRLLDTQTPEGFLFRVDVGLRPQGRSGQLAPPLAFLRQYYDVHGREWERTAMIKARRVAGSEALYGRFQEIIEPFVYRRYLDYSAVEGIAIVKHDIDRTYAVGLERDIKLGKGGIRENEFLVQALQLLYGGKNPSLRAATHSEAIAGLAAAGVLEPAEAEAHRADYWLLRKTENRLQMVDERQVHQLPEEAQQRIPLFSDFQPGFEARLGEAEAALETARRATAERFGQLFSELAAEGFPDPRRWRAALETHLPEEQRSDALARVNEYLNGLMKTRFGERCVAKVGRLLTRPALYRSGTEAAFPRWLEFLEQIGNRNALHALIDANPALVDWVSTLFAEGGHHAEHLIRHPEYLESLPPLVVVAPEVPGDAFHPLVADARSEEEFILAIQQARAQGLIRILTGTLGEPESTAHRAMLSDLAAATVSACALQAWKMVEARYGVPAGAAEPLAGFCVLAMGKLGSREMHFASDLDLMFLYREDGTTSARRSHYELFTRLTQRISSLLTSPTQFGSLYPLDHRLRPFGSKGLLTSSLPAFAAFLQTADTWNFQALTRIRPICGDAALAEAAIAAIGEAWEARNPPVSRIARDVHEMLGRLVAEHGVAEPNRDGRLALKYHPGGMIGYDFLRQFHFLRARLQQGPSWTEPAPHEMMSRLRAGNETLRALDERLSFYDPKFRHEAEPRHFRELAAIRDRWSHEQAAGLLREMGDAITDGFLEFSQ